MMDWSTACPDWETRILARQSLVPIAPLFPAEAEESLAVFRELKIVDVGATMGEACRPWAMDFVASVFGAYDPESGRRLIKEFFMLISKKNTKSTTAAGIMLTALLRNWRESAEYLILAPTVEIANAAYKPAAAMIRADDELGALLEVRDYQRTITHRGTKATLKVVAADSETVAGNKATGVLVDELWLFGKRANAESMLLEATGGQASRPEGFTIYLSTQSDEPPSGVFKTKLAYARDVRDGKVLDKRFLPVLYEFPQQLLKEEKHKDRAYFYVTNPNLGASVDVEFIERKFEQATIEGEKQVRDFLAKHLNVEIGQSLRSDRWAGADFWQNDRVTDKTLTFETLLERCEVVVAGIDGGGLDDLLGFAVLGREKGTRRWLLWCHAWAHPIVLERRKSIAAQLLDFEKAGHLTLVKEPGEDVAAVADYVCRLKDAGLLPEKNAIGVDAAGIGDVVDELMSPERGLQDGQIIAISQGWRLNAAIKTAERKLAGGELVHDASPFMCWVVSNARVEPKGNAILITKQASGTAKIDPLMAALDAVALMSLNPEATVGQSFWEQAA